MTDLGPDHHPRPPGGKRMSSPSPKYTNWSGKPPPPRGSIACVSPMMREQVAVVPSTETGPEHHIYMETPRTPNTQTLIKTKNESHHLLSTDTLRTQPGNFSYNETPTMTCHRQSSQGLYFEGMAGHQTMSHNYSCHNIEAEEMRQIKEHFVMSEEPSSHHELLPICDLMFGAVSLVAYFADIIFDLIIIHRMSDTSWFLPMLLIVIFSSVCSQFFSFRWYIEYENISYPGKMVGSNWSSPEIIGVIITHFFQSGILWRYFRLFVPVNLMTVKHEVGNLCMLRMIHAFLQSAPMALIQIYLIWQKNDPLEVSDAEVTSASLSLFNLCWALASFSKNCQQKHVHKLVLTWLGVIFQFFWRFGMVSSRIVALTVYAAMYQEFVFLVIGLHWFSASLWLLSPRNLVFEGQQKAGEETTGHKSSSFAHRFLPSLFIGWIFNFCYVNLHEENARHKMIAFYCTMFVENTLLACVSLLAHRGETFVYTSLCFWIVWGGFAFGLFAMALYYQCFHIRYIKLSLLASNFDFLSNSNGHNKRQLPNSLPRNQSVNLNQLSPRQTNSSSGLLPPGSNGMMTGIPGVFNCRLNPALKRKKKKPSSFVPRPPEPPSVPENRTATTDRRAEGRAIRENQFVSSSLNPVPAPSRNLQS